MASVVGTIPANMRITFRPIDVPKFESGVLASTADVVVNSDENGAISTTLTIGRYRVFFGDAQSFLIKVVDPTAPATTVNISALVIPGS